MNRPVKFPDEISKELNPIVGRIANRLLNQSGKQGVAVGGNQWEIIQEILDFAASAEQQINEQRNRIVMLENLCMTDELTGLLNRRGLEKQLDNLLARSDRHDECGIIGYLDLDGFKEINDTHGHEIGDEVLRRLSRILGNSIRNTDFAARMGGDEFVILMSQCNIEHGLARLDALADAINSTHFNINGISISPKVSLGKRVFGSKEDKRNIISAADFSMYQEKTRRKKTIDQLQRL